MRIGIFSKLGSSGGSEHRAVEMANGIVRYTNNECWLLCENLLGIRVKEKLDKKVILIENIFQGENPTPEKLYEVDSLLIINTDSYSFTRRCYWGGRKCWKKKPPRHTHSVDLSKIPQMIFLFNFVISPSQHLHSIAEKCPDVRIICANKRFYNEIHSLDKFSKIKNIPSIILNSPIDPESVYTEKIPSPIIRIGRHSKPYDYKIDPECVELIKRINKKYKNKIQWDFMGLPRDVSKSINKYDNVIIKKEYSISVKEYLQQIDIFLFFIKWTRNEPWARVVAEGMASGCPILANNNAGNKDQVRHNKNGYLCNTLEDFEQQLSYLIENPNEIKKMGQQSIEYSKEFTTENIIKKYIKFIK